MMVSLFYERTTGRFFLYAFTLTIIGLFCSCSFIPAWCAESISIRYVFNITYILGVHICDGAMHDYNQSMPWTTTADPSTSAGLNSLKWRHSTWSQFYWPAIPVLFLFLSVVHLVPKLAALFYVVLFYAFVCRVVECLMYPLGCSTKVCLGVFKRRGASQKLICLHSYGRYCGLKVVVCERRWCDLQKTRIGAEYSRRNCEIKDDESSRYSAYIRHWTFDEFLTLSGTWIFPVTMTALYVQLSF